MSRSEDKFTFKEYALSLRRLGCRQRPGPVRNSKTASHSYELGIPGKTQATPADRDNNER